MKELTIQLNNDSLDILNKFALFPMILYNDYENLASNDKFDEIMSYDKFDTIKQEMGFYLDIIEMCNGEFLVEDNHQNFKRYELMYQFVTYEEKNCIFAYLMDVSVKKENEIKIKKLSELRGLMLEVTQAISEQDDLDKIFQLILKNSLKAMDNASLGSILIREGDGLKIASSIGFEKCIDDLKLPLNESFLYKETKGNLDRIININDLTNFEGYIGVNTCLGENVFIKSTLSAPIYINNIFFGMINIDSIKINAFDVLDIRAMEFLKPNIEIALSNHFAYKEKIILSHRDPLTQISNRGYFKEQFPLTLERAIRYNEAFCFVVFDIDGLKKINDNYGHLVGDEVIRRVAKVLEDKKRKTDLLARIGGDEFVGVYLHLDKDALIIKLDLILEDLKKDSIKLKNMEVMFSFTFGIARFPNDGETFEQLFKVADNRMYEKKYKDGIDFK